MPERKKENIGEKVVNTALKILRRFPQGMEYGALCDALARELPKVNRANFSLHVPRLPAKTGKVYKPSYGQYCLKKFQAANEKREAAEQKSAENERGQGKVAKQREEKEHLLYEPVANFLRNIDECVRAIPLGGNVFGGKHNTPDVIGVMRPEPGAVLEFPMEFVSAEVKNNASEATIGFGQACAYRLFSHKSYLVVPDEKTEEMGRVESLCNIFGIGLIVFKPRTPDMEKEPPEFTVRTRAVKHSPDMFYLKKYPDDYLGKHRSIANQLLRGE